MPNDFGYTEHTKVKDVICTCKDKLTLKKLLPVGNNDNPVICYQSCPRVLFTAFMRQIRDTTQLALPRTEIIRNYHHYCDDFFDRHIEPFLKDFTYCPKAWYNAIENRKKQLEVEHWLQDYIDGKLVSTYNKADLAYTMFAKREKQIVDTSVEPPKFPKCRAISAAPPLVKWVGGPVVKALEHIFSDRVPGYGMNFEGKAAKNWEEQEKLLEVVFALGKTTVVDCDGSAWDSTISHELKYLPNKIYQWLLDNRKINHVTPEVFEAAMLQRNRCLTAKAYIDGRTKIVFSANIDSTTFSGSPNTTFDNTLINLSVNHFCANQTGLKPYIACKGDDSLNLVDTFCQTSIDNYHRLWSGLGLVLKKMNVGDEDAFDFCSTSLIVDNGRCKLVRKIDRMNPLAHWSTSALHYSHKQLRQYYKDLAVGYEDWTAGMPFYSAYPIAFRQMADTVPDTGPPPPTGKPKNHYDTDVKYFTDTWKTERTSKYQPSDASVYNFLLRRHGLTSMEIRDIENKITQPHIHSYSAIV